VGGGRGAAAAVDFARVMERVREVVKKVEPHDSVERYTKLGVDCIKGAARISSPYTVEVAGRTLTTRNIIVATGAEPILPPLPGLDQVDYLTSTSLWQLRDLPQRLLVLCGGPIGCELTQAFARFGSEVTQVDMAPRLLMREDPEVGAFLRARFESEGVRVLTDHAAKEVRVEEGENILMCEHQGQTVAVPFDAILVAVGRRARTTGFGLEELGVRLSESGTLDADPFLRTNFPNIFCAGDVAGPYQFTHIAAHQAWHATINALFGDFRKFRADDRLIPWCTFTDPEVARVGLSEDEAHARGIACEVTRYGLDELDRAITDEAGYPDGRYGYVKVLTVPGRDRILGVTIVGEHAGDLLAEYVLAMQHNLGLNKILATVHIYPTLAEANKYAAGAWKRAHAPQALLRALARFHRWRRGQARGGRRR
jgi:pyruvate/2-oxoglutarate dehydrogenase complex dihydrolipoamide dehydrogenase (E3) component